MTTYDQFAQTFSNSRKNLKWQEIEYFLGFLEGKENLKILDVGCGNGRLLDFLDEFYSKNSSLIKKDNHKSSLLINGDNHKVSPLIKGVRGILKQNIKFIPYNADLKEKSRELRKNMTEAEKKIWYKYFKNIDIEVLRQKPLLNYIVDFYIPKVLLVIEIDGNSHYEQGIIEYDKKRTEELNLYGLEILRFTNYEIYNNFEGVCETIEEKIRNRRNPPSPLYQGVIENPITQLYQERIENPPAKFCQEGIGENPPCPPLSRGKRKSAVSPFIMDEKFSYLGVDSSAELLKEAKKLHSENEFLHLNMQDISGIKQKFNTIFFIASFHHLKTVEERKNVLKQAYSLLENGGFVFMTNWALESELNKEKYKDSKIKNSTNEFGSSDFSVKIGKFTRFYHSFSLEELEYLFKESGFEIIENREFEGGKNVLSILKKI